MNPARVLVWVLVVVLPLTAVLVLAVDDGLLLHPSSKHAPAASRATLKLPSGVATPMTALVAPPLLGAIAAAAAPVAVSLALRPPFVPPRG
jgi:Flp pilus assembly protein TadG